MKRLILTIAAALTLSAAATAQVAETTPAGTTPADAPLPHALFGYLNADSLLRSMPEFAEAMEQLAVMKQKYQDEAKYNETTFRRQFAEYLEGQQDFTENIMLKRQADLQESMEKGLAFRHQADSLLRQTEVELIRPLRQRLRTAINAVGNERGYGFVLDTSTGGFPFVNPKTGEDITELVKSKL